MRTRNFFCLFLALISACGSRQDDQLSSDPEGEATVTISDKVVLAKVKRFGINLSENSYWGSGQIARNLVGTNPGFEGWLYGSMVRVVKGGPETFSGESGGGWQDGFWDGAAFEVMEGAARGRKGRITRFKTGKKGGVWTCAAKGSAFARDNLIVLRRQESEPAHGGWWLEKGGVGGTETVTDDVRPGSPGSQSLRLVVPNPGDWATLHAYFDSLNAGDLPFLPLKGTYRLEFWARGEAPDGVAVKLRRLLNPDKVFLEERFVPTSSWQHLQFEFSADNDTRPATLDLSFAPQVGRLQLDDVALYLVDESNTTAFRGEVVSALSGMSPGILRFWAGQLGDSLTNATSASFAQKRTGFSRWSEEPKSLGYSLPEFLVLCEKLDAEPWYVLPITFSEQEMQNLIEYLAAPAHTKWGRLRADAGRIKPWTQVFNQIHLEYGNEAWNGVFAGGTIEDPAAYGRRAASLFAAARRSSFYGADKLQLIMGGQAGWPERNQKIVAAGGDEALSIAPYLMYKAPEGNAEFLIQALFNEVMDLAEKGFIKRNRALMDKAPLCVYEVNLHSTEGPTSQQDLDVFVTSAGAGLAVACHMMNMLAQFGIRDQCLYNLNQYDYKRGDGKRVKLWGAVRDMGPTNRKRPQYLAMVLCNRALVGDLLESRHSGRFQGTARMGQLKSFAFSDGKRSSLLVFNLDRVAVSFRLQLANKPIGPASKTLLNFTALTDTNEDEERVTLLEEPDPLFADGSLQTLAAGSMTLWTWANTGK